MTVVKTVVADGIRLSISARIYDVCGNIQLLQFVIFCLLSANEVRDDYKFAHVLDKEVTKSFNLVANSVVVFVPERFHTEYEPKRHILDKVSFFSFVLVKKRV